MRQYTTCAKVSQQPLLKFTLDTAAMPSTTPSATAMATMTSQPSRPSYTAAIAAQDIHPYDDHDEYDEYDDDYLDHDDTATYYQDVTPINHNLSRTITIKLDSSINIHGDENTLAIASQQVRDQPQPSRSRSKVANTTASIIAALQQSGILAHKLDPGPGSDASSAAASTTVQISIDAGVKVQGSRNMVCFGALLVPGARPYARAPGSQNNLDPNTYDARKRRAQSEPALSEEVKRCTRC
ncbi:hypothetical protein BDW74DRAFT_184021 [Aspergillus multicolor]|uniref:uncharacterized protein n=1 Tax=Aspergillus multicolor TaxID=41759 RepID=UPI003CCE0C3E